MLGYCVDAGKIFYGLRCVCMWKWVMGEMDVGYGWVINGCNDDLFRSGILMLLFSFLPIQIVLGLCMYVRVSSKPYDYSNLGSIFAPSAVICCCYGWSNDGWAWFCNS